MALIDDLRAQGRREARLLGTLTDEFADDAASVLAGLTRRIRQLVRTLESTDGRLVATEAALGRALALQVELRTIMTASGFAELAADAFNLDDIAITVLEGRSVAAAAARTTPIDLDVVRALQDIRQADLLQLGDDLVNAVWRSTLDGVIGIRSVDDLTDELAEVVGVTERQARTLHDTAVSTYSRQVKQLGISPQPTDRFLYVGPNDTKTRPFCQEQLAAGIQTRAEIDALSNGQLPNVLLTGGGFNCRHTWQFVGDLTEEQLSA